MSELYSVEVEQVHAGEVVFRVTTIHPDAGPPREQATFPMNLLVELWDLLDRGFVALILPPSPRPSCRWSRTPPGMATGGL